MNNYYIDKQNNLTEEIKDAVRTMNQNVIELSRENYYLQSKINEIKNYIESFNLNAVYKDSENYYACLVELKQMLEDTDE